jgi:hypothetical protein
MIFHLFIFMSERLLEGVFEMDGAVWGLSQGWIAIYASAAFVRQSAASDPAESHGYGQVQTFLHPPVKQFVFLPEFPQFRPRLFRPVVIGVVVQQKRSCRVNVLCYFKN